MQQILKSNFAKQVAVSVAAALIVALILRRSSETEISRTNEGVWV